MFVVFAHLFRDRRPTRREIVKLRKIVPAFTVEVNDRSASEDVVVSEEAASYVRAVQRGANDKARRAARHEALSGVIGRELGWD